MYHTNYQGDPYWTTGKYGKCHKCQADLKNKRIFYYPKGRYAFCEACGQAESASFECAADDEQAYMNQYGE